MSFEKPSETDDLVSPEEEKEFVPNYEEELCPSFEDAVERIVAEEETNRVILCDIDGVLMGNKDKIPGFSLLNKSEISDVTQGYLWNLREEFGDRVVVVTNRDPNLNLFLSSKYILNKVKDVREVNGPELKIFSSLLKQVPFLAKEEKNNLINYLGELLPHDQELTITSIEDWSFVSLNRKTFLTGVAKKLFEKYGIKSNIYNYVVKK